MRSSGTAGTSTRNASGSEPQRRRRPRNRICLVTRTDILLRAGRARGRARVRIRGCGASSRGGRRRILTGRPDVPGDRGDSPRSTPGGRRIGDALTTAAGGAPSGDRLEALGLHAWVDALLHDEESCRSRIAGADATAAALGVTPSGGHGCRPARAPGGPIRGGGRVAWRRSCSAARRSRRRSRCGRSSTGWWRRASRSGRHDRAEELVGEVFEAAARDRAAALRGRRTANARARDGQTRGLRVGARAARSLGQPLRGGDGRGCSTANRCAETRGERRPGSSSRPRPRRSRRSAQPTGNGERATSCVRRGKAAEGRFGVGADGAGATHRRAGGRRTNEQRDRGSPRHQHEDGGGASAKHLREAGRELAVAGRARAGRALARGAYDRRVAAEDERKQAEIDYPSAIGEAGRAWLRSKPFGNTPARDGALLIDFGYVLQLLDLRAGMSLCELGCGSGWMTRFAARHGVHAEGYDISPEMIEIARELAGRGRARRPLRGRRHGAARPRPPLRRLPALRRASPLAARRPRPRDRPPRAQAGRPAAPRRAELEAPLPGPRRLRRVRRRPSSATARGA